MSSGTKKTSLTNVTIHPCFIISCTKSNDICWQCGKMFLLLNITPCKVNMSAFFFFFPSVGHFSRRGSFNKVAHPMAIFLSDCCLAPDN